VVRAVRSANDAEASPFRPRYRASAVHAGASGIRGERGLPGAADPTLLSSALDVEAIRRVDLADRTRDALQQDVRRPGTGAAMCSATTRPLRHSFGDAAKDPLVRVDRRVVQGNAGSLRLAAQPS